MTKERSWKIAFAVGWALAVLFLLGFGLKLFNDFILAPEQPTAYVPPPKPTKASERNTKIYFAEEGASKLAAETRSITLGNGIGPDAASIAIEVLKGPRSQTLYPTIPTDTRLLDAYQLGDTIVLDFSHEIQTNHTGGSTAELFTVYSIVNTMVENLNGITNVFLLVEGEEVETLAGHLDLSKPLFPNAKMMTSAPVRGITDTGNEAMRGRDGNMPFSRSLDPASTRVDLVSSDAPA